MTNQETIIMIICYVVAYIYSIIIQPKIGQSLDPHLIKFNAYQDMCIVNGKYAPSFLYSGRGKDYIIGKDTNTLADCFVTFWGFSHFVLYVILGYYCPNKFYTTLFIGIAFEIYEWYQFNCADPLDIVFNILGFAFGRYLR